jgi:uncharacterized membrane protein YdjX (TVP38/TMEM64 family)
MEQYLLVALVIFSFNLVPAFAPPTWSALVFFNFRYDLNPLLLILVGVVAAVAGRAGLFEIFRKFRRFLPSGYLANMAKLGHYLEESKSRFIGLLTVFFLSPLSSAQLFEAAALMNRIRLKPLLYAFATGRLISYSFYIFGSNQLKSTSIGQIIQDQITSPLAILIQLLMIVGVIVLGNIDWKHSGKGSGNSANSPII